MSVKLLEFRKWIINWPPTFGLLFSITLGKDFQWILLFDQFSCYKRTRLTQSQSGRLMQINKIDRTNWIPLLSTIDYWNGNYILSPVTHLNVYDIPSFVHFHVCGKWDNTSLPEWPREHVSCTTTITLGVCHILAWNIGKGMTVNFSVFLCRMSDCKQWSVSLQMEPRVDRSRENINLTNENCDILVILHLPLNVHTIGNSFHRNLDEIS